LPASLRYCAFSEELREIARVRGFLQLDTAENRIFRRSLGAANHRCD